MSQNVLVLKNFEKPTDPGKHFRLLCLTGSNKGQSYFLTKGRIVIGRGDECDIKINDSKSSREHAEVTIIGGDVVITDLKSQNGVVVNDFKVTQHKLSQGDTVIIGQTVFKFSVVKVDALVKKEKEDEEDLGNFEDVKRSTNDIPPEKKKKNFLIGVIAILIIVVLLPDDESKEENGSNLKARPVTDEYTEAIMRKQLDEDRELKKKLDAIFQRGQRELREGNYFRAMSEFNLALILSPSNGRASFYLEKAKKALDDEIEAHFIKGRREYDSLKFKGAVQSYCAIARLLQNNREDERFKDAIENVKEIEIQLGIKEGDLKCIQGE
ncbi:MAG: FHA domain-containing protein [Bacteriovoracaceae bacterium]|jgi:pSer/pThr/pTyr-binding forkhead associated (FHA) protein|nr:FHA domain-containing protein [Bacteriovoracaceae bacterium]